ncbi:MAG: hypothetical protein U5J62_01605 [Desulfurivibrio sp.]|nr:hypothetical protein [Desulfurivibrio sp.]
MQCPGQDSRFWDGNAVFETACEECGAPLEFFKDDSARLCKNCGHKMLNPKIDFGCASYCPYAVQCLGELPPALVQKKQDELVEQVAVAVKKRLGQDFQSLGRAGRLARLAGELATEREEANPAVVRLAAYLQTLYQPGQAEAEGEIRALLGQLGAATGLTDEVCAVIAALHGQTDGSDNPNYQTLVSVHQGSTTAQLTGRIAARRLFVMKVKRKIIEIDEDLCDGCGQCVPGCAEGALQIIDGKARLVAEKYCDGLGACLGDCPTGALKLIERAADDFDEEAVEELLAAQQATAAVAPSPLSEQTASKPQPQAAMACGCPSQHIQSFGPAAATPCQSANQPRSQEMPTPGAAAQSNLSHWPIQIRLVPPEAPFLKGAELLIAADCVPVAHPAFNQELLPGKVVLLGCPKFDDADLYVGRLAEIFQTAGLKSITIAIMEVPCCGSMRGILQAAQQQAGTAIPVSEVVVGVRG